MNREAGGFVNRAVKRSSLSGYETIFKLFHPDSRKLLMGLTNQV